MDGRRAKEFWEKAAGYGSVLGLSSMRELMKRLGDPQEEMSILHVAGTNGKGSTCCFLREVLREAGYTVGLYTSPAVFSYHERFCVNNTAITNEELVSYLLLLEKHASAMEKEGLAHPTLFEIETALAFLFFRDRHCDHVILEVGMGGDEDATNVIRKSRLSVFTSIGMDHMAFLGDTEEKIAAHKAGILKEGGCAVSIWQEEAVEKILKEKAERKHASLVICRRADVRWEGDLCMYRGFLPVRLSMEGSFQRENVVLALEAVRCLRRQGVDISDAAVQKGISRARWKGRMERISQKPLCYLDGAHNVPAARQLKETLTQCFTNASITYIIGVLADKEYGGMLDLLLPLAQKVITLTPDNPRALDAETLAREVRKRGGNAVCAESIEEAARLAAEETADLLLAFGSLSYRGEWKRAFCRLLEEKKDV